MSDSKVPDGLVKDSNSGEVKAGHSNVDGVNSDSVKPTGKMRELNCKESKYINKRRFLNIDVVF